MTWDYDRDIEPRLTPELVFQFPEVAWESKSPREWGWRGRCPWHNGSSADSLRVDSRTMAWYCHGCQAGGNALTWIAGGPGAKVTRETVLAAAALAGLAVHAPVRSAAALPPPPPRDDGASSQALNERYRRRARNYAAEAQWIPVDAGHPVRRWLAGPKSGCWPPTRPLDDLPIRWLPRLPWYASGCKGAIMIPLREFYEWGDPPGWPDDPDAFELHFLTPEGAPCDDVANVRGVEKRAYGRKRDRVWMTYGTRNLPTSPIWIVEGLADALAAGCRRAGLIVATMGTSAMRSENLIASLATMHRPVRIIGDNDEPGRAAADSLCESLRSKSVDAEVARGHLELLDVKDEAEYVRIVGNAARILRRD